MGAESSLSEHTGPSRSPAARAIDCAWLTAWCTASVRALSSMARGSSTEKVSESIRVALPAAAVRASITVPAVEKLRSLAVIVLVMA